MWRKELHLGFILWVQINQKKMLGKLRSKALMWGKPSLEAETEAVLGRKS